MESVINGVTLDTLIVSIVSNESGRNMTLFRAILAITLSLIVTVTTFAQEEEALDRPAPLPSDKGIYQELMKLPEAIRKSAPFARFVHRLSRYAGESGVYDVEARNQAFEEAQGHLLRDAQLAYKDGGKHTPFADAWVNVGPTGVGGCTKAIAIHPADQNTIYAGAAGGGVWKSTNAGGAWTILTQDVMPDLATVSIAIDPSDPNTVYVGSGDGSVASDALAGSGLYKSTNAGSSWARMASSTLPKCVNKVLVHPSNSNIVFATNFDGSSVNGKGLYRSTNGGTSFTRVFPSAQNADGVIWDVVPAQTIGGKLIMYLIEGNNPSGSPSSECGIYKSIDDGVTWGKITNATLPAGTSIGKAALACPKNAPEKVFAFIATPSGALQGLYRSTNSGNAWSKINNVPQTIFAPGGAGPQGWYDLCMAVSPNASSVDTILIGGVEAYYSHDGGANWTSYSDYNVNFNVHVDHHAITMDQRNPRIIYIGTDGGIYRSLNAGASWTYRDNGYHTMRFYRIGLDKNDNKRTLGGSQDQGVWQTVSGQSSNAKFGGDGFQPIIDPSNANTFYVEGPYGELYKTTNNGGNFAPINGSAFEEESAWSTPFIMAPKNNQVLYTGRTKVWKTTNAGTSWSAISPAIGTPYILCLAVSPANPNIIYAGLGSGQIKKTTNGGTNWIDVDANASSNLTSIVCHPTNPNFAIASFASTGTSIRAMKTTNGGDTWTNISGTGTTALPGAPVNQLAIDSLSPASTFYAATDNGIYYTLDTGKKWSVAGSGLGLSPCWDVQIHPNKTTIRVGTHGRSIWEANTNILPVELSSLEAVKTTSGTELRWRTDSERGSSHFIVERSYNYATFEQIHTEPAQGNSNTPHEYQHFDPKTDDGYYIYRLRQVDLDGAERLSNTVEVRYGSAAHFRLDQNFPNPFVAKDGGMTKIRFELPEDDEVTLRLYSATGQLVRTIAENVFLRAGDRDLLWDGIDEHGIPAGSGMYQYVLESPRFGTLWNKLVLVGK